MSVATTSEGADIRFPDAKKGECVATCDSETASQDYRYSGLQRYSGATRRVPARPVVSAANDSDQAA